MKVGDLWLAKDIERNTGTSILKRAVHFIRVCTGGAARVQVLGGVRRVHAGDGDVADVQRVCGIAVCRVWIAGRAGRCAVGA